MLPPAKQVPFDILNYVQCIYIMDLITFVSLCAPFLLADSTGYQTAVAHDGFPTGVCL